MTHGVLDAAWLRERPLPVHDGETTKNSRGRVLAVGGTTHVPGALRLTGEAALRAGAGKLQMATVAGVAVALGVLVPEAATIALPADDAGEIAPEAAETIISATERCDTFVLGPGMGDRERAVTLVEAVLGRPREGLHVLLDAAACACAGKHRDLLLAHCGRVVFTPHHGEMSALTGDEIETIAADPERAARTAAERFGGVVVLKAARTIIAAPGAEPLVYATGGVGLATGGSGDVLAGIIAGLLSRGLGALEAAAWGVWVHGEAGRRLAERIGAIGFLARDLLPEIPTLMRGV